MGVVWYTKSLHVLVGPYFKRKERDGWMIVRSNAQIISSLPPILFS